MSGGRLSNILRIFLPLLVVTTLLTFLIYWEIQQNYRLSANDPQIQMAESAAEYLSTGGVISFTDNRVEISKSLSPFELVYDANKKLVTYSGVLNGKPPTLPEGVLDNARKGGEHKITWQPEKGVRSAVVAVYFKDKKEGYVAVGRSLREVEKRENLLLKGAIAAYLATIILSFVLIFFFESRLGSKLESLS